MFESFTLYVSQPATYKYYTTGSLLAEPFGCNKGDAVMLSVP